MAASSPRRIPSGRSPTARRTDAARRITWIPWREAVAGSTPSPAGAPGPSGSGPDITMGGLFARNSSCRIVYYIVVRLFH